MPERKSGNSGARFGGFKSRLAAGIAVLALLGAGGAVYSANLGSGKGEGSDTGFAFSGNSTATPSPAETATPTEVPPSKRLPYKLTENIYGSVGVGVSDGVQKAVECEVMPGKIITCPGLSELYLDEEIDPKGEKLEQFNNKVKWLTWKDRNPDTTLSYNDFVEKLNDPNESFIVTARGFEGSSSLPTEIKVDLKKKIHYVQVPYQGANLYTLDINWKGNIRVLDGELYLEMADHWQGLIADEAQHPEKGIYPAKEQISLNMVRIALIFIDSKSQQARNILVEREGALSGLLETLRPEVLQGEQDGIVKARPVN
jgi:hypothetical protein